MNASSAQPAVRAEMRTANRIWCYWPLWKKSRWRAASIRFAPGLATWVSPVTDKPSEREAPVPVGGTSVSSCSGVERQESSEVVPDWSLSDHLAGFVLEAGVVLCALVVVPVLAGVRFHNDPKELVIDVLGLTSASLCLLRTRVLAIDWTDLFLSLFLVVSIFSAICAASDHWEALRAVGLTLSGAAVFWSSRYLARQSAARPLLDAVAVAVGLVAVTVIVDAFGYGLDFPHAGASGTQSNRNWAAHLLALGMPLFGLQSLAGQTVLRRTSGFGMLFISAAALVLTRSRASWLATMLGAFPFVVLAAHLRERRNFGFRNYTTAMAVLAGVVLAVCLPTKLRWSSSHPYSESAEHILAYDRGSGQFRVTQDRRSLTMIADHPVLGVGPGNWRIAYPSYLHRGGRPRLWYPQLANNDWITIPAERGILAAVFFLGALITLGIGCLKAFIGWRRDPLYMDRSLEPLCAIAFLMTLVVIGSLDPVLQLGASSFVFFLAVGALAPKRPIIASWNLSSNCRRIGITIALLLALTLTLDMVDRMYAISLLVRDHGNDRQVASRIVIDQDWFYNERLWYWFRGEM